MASARRSPAGSSSRAPELALGTTIGNTTWVPKLDLTNVQQNFGHYGEVKYDLKGKTKGKGKYYGKGKDAYCHATGWLWG